MGWRDKGASELCAENDGAYQAEMAAIHAQAEMAAIHAQAIDIERMRKAISDALERLDASLFENAEYAQAKAILRNTLEEGKDT